MASIDFDPEDYIDEIDTDDLRAEIARRDGKPGLDAAGLASDAAFARNTIMRAEMAVRRMREVPRELADLFWHVHGVAL